MATNVEVPDMGESISEAVILRWMKTDGEAVKEDEPLCELETDKATFDLPSPTAGVLRTLKTAGETVRVGEVVAEVDPAGKPAAKKEAPSPALAPAPVATQPPGQSNPPAEPRAASSARQTDSSGEVAASEQPPVAPRQSEPSPRTSHEVEEPARVIERIARPTEPVRAPEPAAASKLEETSSGNGMQTATAARPTLGRVSEKNTPPGSRREPMTKIRRRIAERLVRAQQTAAMLTTFNEVDMSSVLDLRAKHKDQFAEKHGVSLGLMSFFAKATALSLKQFPVLNAEIDGNDIVYHDRVNLSIAVNTDRGLVVPVLRDVQEMSFAQFESEIKRVAVAAREGKLSVQELSGGTFTITNGGVFGSLLSTPILNPPQSGILGMHTIQRRPIVVGDDIVARPMMYVALSYDHRLVDGRDAVQFLVTVKQLLEEPMKMILDV
jgi:2-oxoglutarate dehydrogenase E2 component (dihydrolipoamide succinyltransferase)